MDFEYQVTEQRIALFRSNTKFMTTLRMSAEADIKELARICRTLKDNNNPKSQFGYNCNTRKREVRVPRKNYKGMSIEVGSKRKEISLKSTKLKLTSKKLKRSGMDEVIQLKGSIFGDDELVCQFNHQKIL